MRYLNAFMLQTLLKRGTRGLTPFAHEDGALYKAILPVPAGSGRITTCFVCSSRLSGLSNGFTDTADFPFNPPGKFPQQHLLPILGTPGKVMGQLRGGVFGVLCIRIQQCNLCSHLYKAPIRSALSLLER